MIMNKNIHILFTDKPSKIAYYQESTSYNKPVLQLVSITSSDYKYQNIYITNDKEIKKRNWVLNIEENSIFKPSNDEIYDIKNSESKYYEYCKKVILTTDPELIKDGVQSIDDDFLEWFVKNPSCERVEIVKDKKLSSKSIYDAVEGDLVYSHHGYGGVINSLSKDIRVGIDNYIETAITSETGWETLDINNYKIYDKYYKIIIPKEEPKQEITLEEIEQQIALTELRGMRVVKYLDKYKGQNIYNEIALAIEFGYQLKLEENE